MTEAEKIDAQKTVAAAEATCTAAKAPYFPLVGMHENTQIFKQKVFSIFYNAFIADMGEDLIKVDKDTTLDNSDANLGLKAKSAEKSKIISEGLASSITEYIDTMMISLDTVPPTVISPSGPCTGSIASSFFKIL